MSIVKKLGFFSAFILVLLLVIGYQLDGWWNLITLAFVFIVIPVTDYLVGKDPENISEDDISILSEEKYYRFITYLWTYVQIGVIIFGAYAVTFGKVNTILDWFTFVLATALITGGVGITVAHELGHKKSKLEQFYSKTLLMTVCYMHFFIEHNRGHHVHVGTPIDPATSRKNEHFYKFWFRSVFHGYASAWSIENARLKRHQKSIFNVSNQMIWFHLLPILFCATLTLVLSYLAGGFAWQVPLFFFLQSILAFTLLEQVNYIEHYGIVRSKDEKGIYERVTQLHSWNANQLVSNFFLFQLQRHSDHHLNAIRRYQVLKHYDDSPQLPHGYPSMVILALFPPIWFKMMNQRLEIWEDKRQTS
jgi:alkane 1-monooxygenase